MVNKDRMVSEFLQLVQIDSVSKKERKMADALKEKLESIDLFAIEDNTGEKIGGNAGNIIFTVKGNKKVPAILLMAHMDTVEPGIGKKPILENGYIKSDKKTILGGDDVAGIVCILEALRVIKEKNISHGDIQIVFTVSEETGILGSKNLDYGLIYARYGIVLDSGGPIGGFVVSAPSCNKINTVIKGKAAHAGVEPEKGINAIQIASAAINNMKLGRIDDETTANIGIINGGQATNIICDRIEIEAEVRSREQHKLEEQTAHMKECFENAAKLYNGSVEFKPEQEYQAFNISPDSHFIKVLGKAVKAAGVEFLTGPSGGGSDANVLNRNGIQAVDMCIAMDKVHSVEEQILIDDMVKAAELLVSIITNIE